MLQSDVQQDKRKGGLRLRQLNRASAVSSPVTDHVGVPRTFLKLRRKIWRALGH